MTRILLAESAVSKHLLESALVGYELVTAATFEEAQRLVWENGIELFVICIMFDDSQAIELVRLIRTDAKHKQTPILVTRVVPIEMADFIRQVMTTMKTLHIITDYLEFEGEPSAAVNIRNAVAKCVGTANHQKPVILVVDDMPINLMATTMSVQALGYIVEEASSGAIALNKLESCHCAIILMDLQMPNMSGFECTKKIRKSEIGSNKRIPIIAISSLSESAVKQECLDAGMDGFVDKGCSSEEFAKVLERFAPSLSLPELLA